MDITSLLYFVTVCKYGNFTKASNILHISQSALSRRIKSIEEELDVLLIERGSSPFCLTDVGKIFLVDAERMVKQNDSMLRHIDKCRHNDSLRIGFSQNLYLRPYIDAVCKLKTASPDKMFYFRESSLKSIADDLKNGNLDIIYTTRGEVDGLPGIHFVTVAENDASVLVPRGHRLWNKMTVSFSDLEGERICTINDNEHKSPTASHTVSAMIAQGCPAEAISNAEICESPYELLLYVCGCGYLGISGIIGNSEVPQYPDKVRNIRLECEHINCGDMVLAYRKDNQKAQKVVEFMTS